MRLLGGPRHGQRKLLGTLKTIHPGKGNRSDPPRAGGRKPDDRAVCGPGRTMLTIRAA
jgi:hypothetical protein